MEARYLAMLGVVAAIVGPILAILVSGESEPKPKQIKTDRLSVKCKDGQPIFEYTER